MLALEWGERLEWAQGVVSEQVPVQLLVGEQDGLLFVVFLEWAVVLQLYPVYCVKLNHLCWWMVVVSVWELVQGVGQKGSAVRLFQLVPLLQVQK